MKPIVKNIVAVLLSIIIIITLMINTVALSVENDVSLDQRMVKENEANIQYSLLMNSYKNDTVLRSSNNEKEIIYPDYYAGAYVDDFGDLIVLVTNISGAADEIRAATRNQSITINYVQNSYNELMSLKEYIESKYDEYYSMYSNKVDEADQELLSAIINFTGVGISERTNKVVVGLSNMESEDIELFEKYFISNDKISFEQSSNASEESTSLDCGSAIYTVNGGGSIGYRCMLKMGSSYLHGFVTAGHVTGNAEFTHVYTDDGLNSSSKIGTLQVYKYSGSVDMAFVVLDNDCQIRPATPTHALSDSYFTSIAEGTTIYMKGKNVSGVARGEIENNSYSFTTESGVNLSDCIKSNYPSDAGDSGGVVYALYNGSYCIVGIHHGVKTEWLFWEKSLTIKACNIYAAYDFYTY